MIGASQVRLDGTVALAGDRDSVAATLRDGEAGAAGAVAS
jgi:hypothetical protein